MQQLGFCENGLHKFIRKAANVEIFICVYLVLLFFQRIPLTMISAQKLTGVLIPVWGIILLCTHKMFFNFTRYKQCYVPFLIFFLVAFTVTTFINYRVAFFDHLKTLLWNIILIGTIYLYIISLSFNKLEILFAKIAKLFIFLVLSISVLSFFTFLFLIGGKVTVGTTTYNWGYFHNLLYGFFFDSNHYAIYAGLSILLSFYCICKHISNKKWLYVTNIVFESLILVLTNSRGGYVSISLTAGVSICLCCSRNAKYSWKMFARYCVLFVATVCISMGAIFVQKKALSYIPPLVPHTSFHYTAIISPSTRFAATSSINSIKSIDMSKLDYGSDDVTTGRLQQWKEALQIFARHPMFGIGSRSHQHYAQKYIPNGRLAKGFFTHNSYIDLLLSSGIVGTVFMVCFGIKGVVKSLHNLDKSETEKSWFIRYFSIISLIFICSTNFFLSNLFFTNSLLNLFFWFFCGVSIRSIGNDSI